MVMEMLLLTVSIGLCSAGRLQLATYYCGCLAATLVSGVSQFDVTQTSSAAIRATLHNLRNSISPNFQVLS